MEEETTITDAILYQQPDIVPFLQSIPRMGRPTWSDVLEQYDEDPTIVPRYLSGLTLVAAIVSTVVILTFLSIAILKCLPQQQAGFLSGRRFSPWSRNTMPIRVVFLITALGWIVCTILGYREGIDHISKGVETIQHKSGDVDDLLYQANTIVTKLDEVAIESSDIREILVPELANFCPKSGNSAIFDESISDLTGFDVDNDVQGTMTGLQDLGDFLDNEMKIIEAGLDYTSDAKANYFDITVEQSSDHFHRVFFILMILLYLVPICLVVGVVWAWVQPQSQHFLAKAYEAFLQWFILPLLIVVTIATASIAASFSMVALANADICTGEKTPQGTILKLLEGAAMNPEERLVLESYITGKCSVLAQEDPFGFLQDYRTQLDVAMLDLQSLHSDMHDVTTPILEDICGRSVDDYHFLLRVLRDMKESMGKLDDQIANTQDLVDCRIISPVLTEALNEGVCYSSLHGFASTFICFSAISLMGLILIIFRSSYLRVGQDDDDTNTIDMMIDDDIIRPFPTSGGKKKVVPPRAASFRGAAREEYGLPSHRPPFLKYDES